MKLSAQNARADSAGLHNDRKFDMDYAPHINQEKVMENRYWTYNGEKEASLAEIELDFYKKHFQKYITEQNERNKKSGHSERNRTLKQYYSAKQTRPEDKIIQIGDKDNHPDPEVLWDLCLEYQKRFEEIFGDNCKILDMALHVDEATPHVHIRRVWMYEDGKGLERVGQTKALEKLGILEKDTSKEVGRFNNAKITFTAQERQLFRDICQEKGIELEADQKSNRRHLSVPEYKQAKDEMNELELQTRELRQELEELKGKSADVTFLCDEIDKFLTAPAFYNIHDQEVAEARKKNLAKRAADLIRLFKEESDKVVASEGSFRAMMEEAYNESKNSKLHKEIKSLNHKVELLNQFVLEKGLGQELVDYLTNPKSRTSDSPHRTLLQ